jgi:hypothetical protein
LIVTYRYALAAPSLEVAAEVESQLRLAHSYYNELIEAERDRRDRVRAEIGRLDPHIASLEAAYAQRDAAVTQLLGQLKQARSASRSRVDDALLQARLKAAKETSYKALKDLNAARRKVTTAASTAIGHVSVPPVRAVYSDQGLYWGTYNLVEESVKQAGKIRIGSKLYTMPLWDGLTPRNPRFRAWDGAGTISVQLQHGAEVAQVCADTHTQLRIRVPREGAWDVEMDPHTPRAPGCGHRRYRRELRRHGELSMRVRSGDGGKPVWGVWRMDMHRPLPADGVIKEAKVHRVKVGPLTKWHVTIMVETQLLRPAPTPTASVIGVDVGWLSIDSTWRIAASSDGDEIRILEKQMLRLEEPARIRSRRDHVFNIVRDRLCAFVRAEDRPEWLREATTHVHAWRSPKHMVRLLHTWREARFAGDEEIFSDISGFVTQDRYDWTEESVRRQSALAGRLELYRVFAAQLADRCETIVLRDMDLSDVARREDVTPDTSTQDAAQRARDEHSRSRRQLCAPGELREAIINAARTRGRQVVHVASDGRPPCRACGSVNLSEPVLKLDTAARHNQTVPMVTCLDCGDEADSDRRQAEELVRAWIARPGDAKIVLTARAHANPSGNAVKREGRFQKRKRIAASKTAAE